MLVNQNNSCNYGNRVEQDFHATRILTRKITTILVNYGAITESSFNPRTRETNYLSVNISV